MTSNQVDEKPTRLATECTLSKESGSDGLTDLATCSPDAPVPNGREVKSSCDAVDGGGKDYLTESEMMRFLNAARSGRHGTRDFAMMLMTYRHGLRVSELIDIRLTDLDLVTARLFVRRKKGSLSTHQPVEGDELRAIPGLAARTFTRQQRGLLTVPVCGRTGPDDSAGDKLPSR